MTKDRKLPNGLFLKKIKQQADKNPEGKIKQKLVKPIRKKVQPSHENVINPNPNDIFMDDDLKLSSSPNSKFDNQSNLIPPSVSPRRNNANIFLGFIISLVFFIWMISGFITNNNDIIVKSPEIKPANGKFTITPSNYENIDIVRSDSFLFNQTIKTNGIINASKKGEITTPISGKIIYITNKSGKYVKRGEIIAKISDIDYRAQYNNKKSVVSTASVVHKTNIELFEKNLISELELNNSLNSYLSAKAEYEKARKNLIDTVIYAPYSGKINEILIQKDQYLKANQAVVNIVSNSNYYLDIDVPEDQLKYIKIGKKIIASSVSGRKINGKIKYINNTVNTNTNTYTVRSTIYGKNFIDGSFADVEIIIGKIRAHKIPASLITLNKNGEEAVKVLGQKNIVEYKKVKIHSADENSIIVSGLSRNERIINKGYGFVKQGQKISTFNISKEFNK